MPRKYFNSTAVEMESLPNWVKSSRTDEKGIKVASDDGETERLKKRGREMHARRNMKETERMLRYEESMKKREKMIKQDKRKSEIAKRGLEEADNHSYNTGSKLQHGRWQMGDGMRVASLIHKEKNAKRSEKNAESKKQDKKSESRKCSSKVKIVVEKSRGKERAREWVEAVQREYNSDERVLIGRSWAWFSVPLESEISEQESDQDENAEVLKKEYLQDYPVSWPISRFCLEDTTYIPVLKPLRVSNISGDRDVAPAPMMVPDTSDTSGTFIKRQPGNNFTNKTSFKCRIASMLRSISRRVWGKTM